MQQDFFLTKLKFNVKGFLVITLTWNNIAICFTFIIQAANSYDNRVKITLKLIQYYNPNQNDYNGNRCELTNCDYVFKITIGTSNSKSRHFSMESDTFDKGESFTFPPNGRLAPNINNPILVNINESLTV